MPMRKSKPKKPVIEINAEFQQALNSMEQTNRHIFITGRAGTGKSTLLDYFRTITRKKVAVLAPTGVSALNVKGQTIHSFFKFKPNTTLDKIKKLYKDDDDNNTIYRRLDTIIIDEVSMVRADLLDCIDKFLGLNGPERNKPFGGIQMVFIGDLYQLPPVVTSEEKMLFATVYDTPYFFSARVFERLEMEFIELNKIYRQHDELFIKLLNAIRNNSVTDEDMELLNQRYIPDYEPPPGDFYIHLTTTNNIADTINNKQLEKLDGTLYTFTGIIEGNFGKEYLPTSVNLPLKIGSQVMLLNNDIFGRWVNGSVGKVSDIEITEDKKQIETAIMVELPNGDVVDVLPYTWEIFRYSINGGQLQSDAVGKFTQYPIMLAWAVTIHKSQGKTFDKVIIDIGKGTFAHGQLYVALSRCTTLEGLILKKPLRKNHIWMDYKVVKFLTRYQYGKAEQACSLTEKVALIQQTIERGGRLRIVYLKPSDEKTERIIQPKMVGEMEFHDVNYIGVEAFCFSRKQHRVFRVDRILKLETL